MAEVVWTPRALHDLEAIGAYHAASAPGHAALLVRRLMGVAERLGAFPQSGRIVPEIGDSDFREVLHRAFWIVYLYREEGDTVEVLAVFHSSRPFGAEER